jgi:hypothetical protein
MPTAIFIGLGAGLLMGLFNGLMVIVLQLPSIIVTIGTLILYRGLAQVIAGDKSIRVPDWYIGIDKIMVAGIPLPVAIFVVLSLILGFVLGMTIFGRRSFDAVVRLAILGLCAAVECRLVCGRPLPWRQLVAPARLTLCNPVAGSCLAPSPRRGVELKAKNWEASMSLPARRVPLQNLFPPQGEAVDRMHDLAHRPGGRRAALHFAVLVHQHQRKAARAQALAHGTLGGRVGVGDHHHVTLVKANKVGRDVQHLAAEVRVVRGVGKDHHWPTQPQELVKVPDFGGVVWPDGERLGRGLVGQGSTWQYDDDGKDMEELHAAPLFRSI